MSYFKTLTRQWRGPQTRPPTLLVTPLYAGSTSTRLAFRQPKPLKWLNAVNALVYPIH